MASPWRHAIRPQQIGTGPLDRINLQLDPETFEAIDVVRAKRP